MAKRTRASNRWTESRFWAFLRSNLRRASVRWPPRPDAKNAARREYAGDNKRQKWEYQCESCGGWYMGKEVEVDHRVPCGSLKSYEDVEGFVRRLFCEAAGFRVLCKACHKERKK